jgi:hypothetical protein
MTNFLREIKWMMDVLIFQINEKLGFFMINGISEPKKLEFGTVKMASMEHKPITTKDPS